MRKVSEPLLPEPRGARVFADVSPDGKRIAFTSTRDGNYEIYVMDIDGQNVRQITHHEERDDYPAWHPDGRLLVVSERAGRFDLYLYGLAKDL